MAKKISQWQLLFLLLLIIGTIWILRKQVPYQTDQGIVFGTMYKITYQSETNLKEDIEKELQKVDHSLSPFNKNSIISGINNNEDVQTDSLFNYVFLLAQHISKETHGAFDITVAPLVNAWGFGFKHSGNIDSTKIDSLRQFVGYQKVQLSGQKVIKQDPRTMLDCSAIAKGFGVDCVARLFDRKGIKNYMIDIGGELSMKGENSHQQAWRIGINKPIDDSLSVNQEIQTILEISNVGLATSGNYRNFYYKDGKKYAHTIDPRTGFPVQHNILSSTVIAPNCATADAYATAFMVMGMEQAKAVLKKHPELQAYFIYSADNGQTATWHTPGLKQFIEPAHQHE